HRRGQGSRSRRRRAEDAARQLGRDPRGAAGAGQRDRRRDPQRARADAARAVGRHRRSRCRAVRRRRAAQEPRRARPRGDRPAGDGLRDPAARRRVGHRQGPRRARPAPRDRVAVGVVLTLKRRLVDYALTGLLILLPALVLRASLSRGSPSGLDQALLRITAPLEAGVSWIVEGIGGVWSRYVALVDIESENRELRAENERLRKELATMTRRAFDVAALEDLAVVKKKTEADTIGARVIGAPLSPQFRVLRLRIDRGEREVSPKMPVITSEGPVGTISNVYGDYADVQLISEKDYKIDVVIKRTGARGSLIGQGNPDTYACTLESDLQAKPEMRVQVGDEVVASGV